MVDECIFVKYSDKTVRDSLNNEIVSYVRI